MESTQSEKMAAVVRVKRRRCDDPAEALYLSCVSKRAKRETASGDDVEEVTSVLKFAATVPTKEEHVYNRIRHAISRDQLQKEYKQHAVDMRSKMRSERKTSTQAGRYKVISRHRELEVEDDSRQEGRENNESDTPKSPPAGGKSDKCEHKTTVSEGAGTVKDSASGQRRSEGGEAHPSGAGDERSSSEDQSGGAAETRRETGTSDSTAAASREAPLWVYDVEMESQEPRGSQGRSTSSRGNQARAVSPHSRLSDIMCNGARMVATPDAPSEEYVYDLYYVMELLGDESVVDGLKIEAFPDLFDYRSGSQDVEDGACDADSDDSNAEDNWRNDYPDEDEFEDSGEEDFEGNVISHHRRHNAGLDPEDADPDFADLPQAVVDQLFIDGSAYGAGGKPKPLHQYFDELGSNDENDNENDDDYYVY